MFLLLSLLLCTKSLRRKMIESLKKLKFRAGRVHFMLLYAHFFSFFYLFCLCLFVFFLFVSDFSFQLRTSLIDTRSRA